VGSLDGAEFRLTITIDRGPIQTLLDKVMQVSNSLAKTVREQAWTFPESSRIIRDKVNINNSYEQSVGINRWRNFRRYDYIPLDTSVNSLDICSSGPTPYSSEVSRRLPQYAANAAPLNAHPLNITSFKGDGKYHYLPLNHKNDEIRLLRLLPGEKLAGELVTVSLAEFPRFVALSYAWGDRSERERIYLDRGWLYVTTNLAAALRNGIILNMIEESDLKAIWADAICINQDDNNEKGQQVMRMRQIYMQAKTVIWLGSEADNSQDAVALIRKLSWSNTLDFETYLLALQQFLE
jgi:hypothetical protein